jgi:hypothetical protein
MATLQWRREMIIAPHRIHCRLTRTTLPGQTFEGHGGGIKDAITWARDSFRNRDGRAVMQDWMLHWDRDGDSGDHRRSYHEHFIKARNRFTFVHNKHPS